MLGRHPLCKQRIPQAWGVFHIMVSEVFRRRISFVEYVKRLENFLQLFH